MSGVSSRYSVNHDTISTEGEHPPVSAVRRTRRLTDAERTELLEAVFEDTDGSERDDEIGARQLVEQAANSE